MKEEKTVVIGCDNMNTLSVVLRNLCENSSFSLNFISAAREGDLINIARSLNPSLVILCFSDNQRMLRDFDFYVNKPGIPILCLTQTVYDETLCWSDQNIVFTYPLEHIEHKEYLSSRIRSIFLLRKEAPGYIPETVAALPEAGISSTENERNLSRYVLELDQKREVLLKVKERIVELFPSVDDPVRTELASIVNSIKITSADDRIWEDFKVYFEKIDPHFLANLSKKHPSLTSKDLKYCCYLKMNMSNDDIRNILGINQESVRTHKYRLKKKMALSKEQDLRLYVRSVGHTESVAELS